MKKKKVPLFERKFTLTKKHIKEVLDLTEEEYLELVEALEGEMKVRNNETIVLVLTVKDVEH